MGKLQGTLRGVVCMKPHTYIYGVEYIPHDMNDQRKQNLNIFLKA